MIHDILPADVEFARGRLHGSHSDAEIVAALASRGIEPAEAAQLLDDLRHGRPPSFNPSYGLGVPVRIASDRAPATAEHSPSSPVRRRRRHRSPIPWWFVCLALFFLGALGYALFMTGSTLTRQGVQQDKHEVPPAFAK